MRDSPFYSFQILDAGEKGEEEKGKSLFEREGKAALTSLFDLFQSNRIESILIEEETKNKSLCIYAVYVHREHSGSANY